MVGEAAGEMEAAERRKGYMGGLVARFARKMCMGNQIFSSLWGCKLGDPAFSLARCQEALETPQDEHMVERAVVVN